MSATNTPNQGFPLAQLADSPCALTDKFAALAAQADAKGALLDADGARVASPPVVKISNTLGYKSANDPTSIGPLFDTVEWNKGTPTDLSKYNGLILNRGFWLVGVEIAATPVASFGNNFGLNPTLSTGSADPLGGSGWASRVDLLTFSETIGFPPLFSSLAWGFPTQYLNGCTMGLAASDGCTAALKGIFSWDVTYMTLWAVQLGDFGP